jgi:hypothetical protein
MHAIHVIDIKVMDKWQHPDYTKTKLYRKIKYAHQKWGTERNNQINIIIKKIDDDVSGIGESKEVGKVGNDNQENVFKWEYRSRT